MDAQKPILFVDYNKVISYYNFWFSLENPAHKYHSYLNLIERFLFRENKPLVDRWMTGEENTESIHEKICSTLDIDYKILLNIFINDCKNLDAPSIILDKLEQAEGYFIRILRTDNMDSFSRFTLPNNKKLASVFDQIDNSYELKELKTHNNGSYFIKTAEKYSTDIKGCFLIDDSEKNCTFFQKLGGTAIQATGEHEVAKKIEDLINSRMCHR